jgi:threonine/homoserine/homoserine lactone efflux protein
VRRGFWAGPALAVGHGAVELLLVIGLALGLNELLDNDAVTATVALAGGAFLVWMGASTAMLAPGYRLDTESAGGGAPSRPSRAVVAPLLASGVLLSVSNPFWLAWWATIGTAYIVEALDQGVAGVGAFYTAHILTDIGWLSIVAFAVAGGRRIMSRRLYQGVLIACGVFLVALGGWFLASGIGYIT